MPSDSSFLDVSNETIDEAINKYEQEIKTADIPESQEES
jgi:hypothetical protein